MNRDLLHFILQVRDSLLLIIQFDEIPKPFFFRFLQNQLT